ncbi:hypothetical protein ISO79_02150 [Morganella morganii subsp. morganii]|uniref:hypothetical protein n=1 Tax=Morganella morganii TaxID=582 RepID=UPI001BDA08AC|nr:hypothetical protein [Morganella morganii]MBT0372536.1 hypothetical protein [Morganella morganii subsp. morganii]HDU8625967.1 hypothetical protein [Morganella morganii]
MTKEQKVLFLVEQSIQCALSEIRDQGYLHTGSVIKSKIDNYYYSLKEILEEKLAQKDTDFL